jgi:pimeloyl-ACP methyl ester carboxylesterase
VCAQRGGPLLAHDSTADVARDMDVLRQAVGDPVLNYWGLSYGTGLGAVYANLFPATVGHMVLDGNLNPVAWTHAVGDLTTHMRLNTDEASAATLATFLDLCGKTTTAGCAFSAGTPAATRAKWNTLLRRLRAHPVTAGSPARTYTYADAVASVPLAQVSQWQTGASLLQQLWAVSATGQRVPTSATTPPARHAAAFAGGAAAAQPAVHAGVEQQLGEFCADGPNPRDLRVYPALARLAYLRAGAIGPATMWPPDEPCAEWPATAGQDRYTGPWNRPTSSPILVMGNTGDPRTAYQNSVAMSRDLARARLLTIDGYGHTEFLNPSTCATDYAISYLLNGTLPAAGTVCEQDTVPFPLPAGAG